MGRIVNIYSVHHHSTVLKHLDLLGHAGYCKEIVVLVEFNTAGRNISIGDIEINNITRLLYEERSVATKRVTVGFGENILKYSKFALLVLYWDEMHYR